MEESNTLTHHIDYNVHKTVDDNIYNPNNMHNIHKKFKTKTRMQKYLEQNGYKMSMHILDKFIWNIYTNAPNNIRQFDDQDIINIKNLLIQY